MIQKSDYIVYNGATPVTGGTRAQGNGQQIPLSAGVWQKEALEAVGMYAPGEGGFSPVKGEQLTLFPTDPVSAAAPVKQLDLDDPKLPVSHRDSFRFFAKDSQRQIRNMKFYEQLAKMRESQHSDAVTATNGELLVDGKTELKEDQFPGRVSYTEGGLYTKDPDRKKGETVRPEIVAEHRNAPNYRKMENKPVHGVGQPTRKGFEDVLKHLGAKGEASKPVVWTNTRAEAIVYIGGEPFNLREVASRENLLLKEGATGAEVEAMELQLKERLIEKARHNTPPNTIQVPVENPGPGQPKTKEVSVTADNVQTTREVIEELKGPPNNYNIEYKRIPLVDEKAPTPGQVDEIRGWMNDVQSRHPKDKDKMEYVFNCHQGRGRTTTGMVAAGIALDGLDGKTLQLELPFGMKFGENAQQRGDRVIDEAFHMQNLRETVAETQDKSKKALADAAKYDAKAQDPSKTAEERADFERLAKSARETSERYENQARDFTKRYAMMQKYSEYIDKYGAHSNAMSFDEWMKQSTQCDDLEAKWCKLNTQLGLLIPQNGPGQSGMAGRADVALA